MFCGQTELLARAQRPCIKRTARVRGSAMEPPRISQSRVSSRRHSLFPPTPPHDCAVTDDCVNSAFSGIPRTMRMRTIYADDECGVARATWKPSQQADSPARQAHAFGKTRNHRSTWSTRALFRPCHAYSLSLSVFVWNIVGYQCGECGECGGGRLQCVRLWFAHKVCQPCAI